MNWRALGCGALAAAAFILLGIVGIFRAGGPGPGECPGSLPTEAGTYAPVGTPMASPGLEGVEDELEVTGEVQFGVSTWPVLLPPDLAPRASGQPLPPRIVLDCRDGTYLTFQRGTQ